MRDVQTRDSSTEDFKLKFQAILESIKNNTATEINLVAENLRDDKAIDLAGAIRNNESLKKLNLSHNEIGDVGTEALANALGVNKTITNLGLSYNNIGDVGAQALAEALKVNKTLTKLDLIGNEIKVDGAQALAEALKVNGALTELDLSYNNIRDDGAKALAEALKVNDNLTKLVLSGNDFKNVGAQALAEALIKNFTVLELRMPSSINEDLETRIGDCLTRNKKIDEIATQIFDNYSQKDPATSPFPRIDDELIKDHQIYLKILEKSLSKIIDSKKANGQEVNEEQIKKEFIEHLKSSGGDKIPLSFINAIKESNPSTNPSSPRANPILSTRANRGVNPLSPGAEVGGGNPPSR